MTSTKRLNRLLAEACEACEGSEERSHCAVEWDEDGRPVSVVLTKDVTSSRIGEELAVGDPCKVSMCKGSKKFTYDAKLLGIGTKKSMESLLNSIEQSDSSSDHDSDENSDEDNASLEIALQGPTAKSSSKVGTKSRKRQTSAKRRPAAKRTVSVKKRCERENNRASEELFNLLSDHPVSDGEGDVEVVREKRKSGGEDDVEVLSETPKSKRTKLTDEHHSSTQIQVTEESLLSGLSGSPPTSSDHVSSGLPPTGLTPSLITTSTPSLVDPALASPLSLNLHHQRRPLYDLTNGNRSRSSAEASFVEQLSLLKVWLESNFRDVKLQIGDLRRKIISVEDSVEQLRETVVKKRSKKVQFDMAGRFGRAHVELGCDSSMASGHEDIIVESMNTASKRTTTKDPLEVCCGDPKKASCVFINVPSEAALSQFRELAAFPPKEPSKYALKLLSVFFTDSELAESNCTRAEGRKLLDQDIIIAIKEQTNYKYPVEGREADLRWHNIVAKVLNNKCRCCRKKFMKGQKTQDNQENSGQ